VAIPWALAAQSLAPTLFSTSESSVVHFAHNDSDKVCQDSWQSSQAYFVSWLPLDLDFFFIKMVTLFQ
jgi:hypothetical protein